MKKALMASALSFALVSFCAAQDAHAEEAAPHEQSHQAHKEKHVHWGYTGAGAAHIWGDLDAKFETCKTGIQQSPVNIDQYIQDTLEPLTLAYSESSLEVVNNGHTVQVNYAPGSNLTVEGNVFELKQFHFHTPSEHYVDGAPYPMEVHLVHMADDGALAVIGVMLKVGAHNPVIEGIWQNVPKAGESKTIETVKINAGDLLPIDKGYYKYPGSLTTPPCTEGVHWHVMKDVIELSAAQLKAFQAVFPVNARPIQDLGNRTVKGN